MKPCSICGGDHKAGKRGEGHAKAMHCAKASGASSAGALSSSSASASSTCPSTPTGAGDQGGFPAVSDEVLQGE